MAAPRPAKDLKPTDERAKLLKKMQQDKTKRLAEDMRKKAREQAASKKVQPAKDVDHRRTKTSDRAKFLREAKKGNIKAAPAPKAGPSLGSRVGSALKYGAGVGATAAGFYFGDTFGKGDLNRGEKEFMETIKRKAGKGYGDKPVGPFKPMASGGARPERPGSYPAASRSAGGARPETPGSYPAAKRQAAGTYTKSYDVAPKKAVGAPKTEASTAKTATDKSRVGGGMTNFQRMKARQFEKEGVAGRSMTSAAAQKRATEKTGGMDMSGIKAKISIFGTKKAEKPAEKSKSERAAAFRALMQGRAK